MSEINPLIPGAITVLSILVALFFKNKATKAEDKVISSEVQVKDAPLQAQQAQDEAAIQQVDAGLQHMIDEKKKIENQQKTNEERADSWNKT